MDEIERFFVGMYPNNTIARSHFRELWCQFRDAGVADRHFVSELTGGDEGQCWARIWEMLLYRLLVNAGFQVSSKNRGPDFAATINGRRSWFEAICPTPKHIPEDWLEFPEPGRCRVRTVPHEQLTLRLTAAICEKNAKFTKYLADHIIPEDEPRIIAVNSGLLGVFPTEHGVSGAPLIAEAVFPIGPWAFPVIAGEGRLGEPYRAVRPDITNHNNSPVPTTAFLDPAFSGVSAVLACSKLDALNGFSPIIVHNPLARTPFPVGLLPGAEEYVADGNGDEFVLRRCEK